MSYLSFRNPAFVAKSTDGGIWATAATVSTGVSSATGLPSVDTSAVVTGKRFQGVKADLPLRLNAGASGATSVLTVGLKIQHCSASGGTYADLGDTGYTTTTITANTATGITFTRGVASISRSLIGAKKFVKIAARRQASTTDTDIDIAASAFTLNFFGPSVAT